MTEPRKPIFGFLWPRPDPDAPVDMQFRQVRRVRIQPRGPIRAVGLLVGTVLTVIATGTTILANVQLGLSLLGILASAACATCLLLVLRGWVVGTFVNDDGVIVESTWRRTGAAWSAVRAVDVRDEPCPLLGLPGRVPGRSAVLILDDGSVLPTHVYSTSPDLWLRPEAFDIACLRLANWQDGR